MLKLNVKMLVYNALHKNVVGRFIHAVPCCLIVDFYLLRVVLCVIDVFIRGKRGGGLRQNGHKTHLLQSQKQPYIVGHVGTIK